MEYAKSIERLDEVIQVDDKKLLIDPKALMFLIGMTIDYASSSVLQEFVFSNPNATGTCGCGESFTVN